MKNLVLSENGKMATRDGYGRGLLTMAEEKNFYVLCADLADPNRTAWFKEKYPERFIECGIAEGNMMSVAAGIATTGVPVFASSFAIFAAGRAYEQVRNSIAYPHLNVKIGATHAGLSVGEDGATHQCIEDIALMRVIPGMTVLSPCDGLEAQKAVEAALAIDGPVYIRLGRAVTPIVTAPETPFEVGKGVVLADGGDAVIFATGILVAEALGARKLLAEEGIDAAVVNIHTVKPLDTALITAYAQKCGNVFTLEEHSVVGGLGSAVCECLAEACPTFVTRIGVQDVFGVSGDANLLLDEYRLTAPHIAAAVRTRLKK